MPLTATAVIAAAGSGERLGAGGPKAFVELAGKPLLAHSLEAIAAAQRISAVVIAAPPGPALEQARALLAQRPALDGVVVAGGPSRAESVALALAHVETELVLVHDAARPLAPPALWDAIVARLEQDPDLAAVIAAAPVTDTIKRAEPGAEIVTGTIAREGLWAAQTPQGFRVTALREAQETARSQGRLAGATDEARLIEEAGGRVTVEPAPTRNLKVTTADDLLIAAALLGGPRSG
jgi:2-C-methyl-D-erythritol 4-phosphate cytidylyltransferase